MRRPTGSKLPLAMLCPASMALPWIDEPVGDMAIRGTVIHDFLEDVARYSGDGDPDDGHLTRLSTERAGDLALEHAPVEAHTYLRALDLDALAEYLQLEPELAFALDWRNRTARVLGSGLGRAYPELGPTEIPLTVDLCGVSPTRVRVSDYKTGRTRYGRPEQFAQLQAGALAACWAFGRDAALVELVYLDEHSETHVSRGDLDGWALDSFASELEACMDQVGEARRAVEVGSQPDVRPGNHCVDLYCPAYRACPAKTALVRHMPEHVHEIQRPGYLAPARVAVTWRQIQEVRRVIGVIEEEIRGLSILEPIDLGDGDVLGPRERRVESIDARVAYATLLLHLGEEFAEGAVSLRTTKAAIEEQARIHRDRNPKDADGKRVVLENKAETGLLDRLYAEIRRQGGASVKVTNNPTIYKRKALP